jgi:hypothetical protein
MRCRRRTVLGLAAMVVTLRLRGAAASDMRFADWINALYLGAVLMREAAERGKGADMTDAEIQALFTPEVQKLRLETRNRVMPASEPVGPILDILFGWGALPNRRIEVVAVKPDGEAGATVDLAIDGNPRRLRITGLPAGDGQNWQIDDIDYGAGGPDRSLRGRLARMQTWAQP